jgi:hypothetical protein
MSERKVTYDGFESSIVSVMQMQNGKMVDIGLTFDGLCAYYGPDLMYGFVTAMLTLPPSSTERVALAYEYFGRDGAQILSIVESTNPV